MFVPAVLRKDFAGWQVEPHRSHERRDGIKGEQVVSQGREQRPRVLPCREPRLDGPQPVGVVQCQGQQARVEQVAAVACTVGRVQQVGSRLHLPQQTFVSQAAPLHGVRPESGLRESSRRVFAWPSGGKILVCAW